MKRLLSVLILIITVAVVLNSGTASLDAASELETIKIDGTTVVHYNTTTPILIPKTYIEKSAEFRGAWVATVWNLDMPKYTSETQFKTAFSDIVQDLVNKNMNVMVFQVRSQNDAYYDSEYAPWGKWVTGTEGVEPVWNDTEYDIMEWMIKQCHDNGIEFHAWLNPYRVASTATATTEAYLNSLHDENWAKQNPDMVIRGTGDQIILNPGKPEVKQYIRDVIGEIMTNYDVDGIHFDDYFYVPTTEDVDTYNQYSLPGQDINAWRRENVNDVIRGVKEDVDAYNTANGTSIEFGVSPPGVWASKDQIAGGSNTSASAHSSYFQAHADTKKWVEEGWLDYIAPQLYRDFHHSLIPYADITDWWAEVCRGTDVDLIVGHALYMTHFNDDEVSIQLRYNQKHPEIKGSIMYRYANTDNSRFAPVLQYNWTTMPQEVYQTSSIDSPDISISGETDGVKYQGDVTVTLTSLEDVYYRLNSGDWTLYTNPILITEEGETVLYYKAIDSVTLEESLISSYTIDIDKINLDIPTLTITGNMIGSDYEVGSVLTLASEGASIWYRLLMGAPADWVEYTGPITLTHIGNHTIYFKTINDLGVESDMDQLSFKTAVSCFDNPTMQVEGNDFSNDPYFNDVQITLTSETDILYKINDGGFTSYDSVLRFNEEGTYTITYKNDDACGVEQVYTFHVDLTAPNSPTLDITGEYDGERYYTSEQVVKIIGEATDDIVYYRLHNGSQWTEWQPYTEPIHLMFNVVYTLEYSSLDQAGNASEVLDHRFRMQIPPREDNMYVYRDGEIHTYYNSDEEVLLPTEWIEKSEEVRAVWVATVGNIDLPQQTTIDDYKSKIIVMLDTIERNNFNTIFFQVRPMNDAWYDSEYAPWSEYITGVQGQDPGWDIFGFIIEQAHLRGIEVHAWLNPYRVSNLTLPKNETLSLLADDNFAKQHPDFVMQDKAMKLILNPGEPQVQAYIKNVIGELMAKYDVDGIHFDDYFYSYNGMSDLQDADEYDTYKNTGESLDDWRRRNVDELVRDIFNMVEEYNANNSETVKFGISPFGIWASSANIEGGSNTSPYALSSYTSQYADSKKWVEEGWLHYILPQLYWEFDHSAAPYADLVKWWAGITEGTDVDLIIGHGFYRYDNDSWTEESELLEQLRYASKYDSVIGHSFFTYNTLLSSDSEVVQAIDRLNNYYWTEYVSFPWASDVVKADKPWCLEGQVVIDGTCEDVPVCDVNEELVDNECVCVSGYELVDGECVVEVVTPECGANEELVDNECVCEEGYEEVEGECSLVTEPEPEPEDTGCFSTFGIGSIVVLVVSSLGATTIFAKRFKR